MEVSVGNATSLQRVLELEKKMKQVINDNKKGKALSKRDKDLIQQIQEENRKLDEQIRTLTLEIENIKIEEVAGPPATQPEPCEYDGKLQLALLDCYLYCMLFLVIVNQ